jgi:hypothetical protein
MMIYKLFLKKNQTNIQNTATPGKGRGYVKEDCNLSGILRSWGFLGKATGDLPSTVVLCTIFVLYIK